MRTFTTTLIKQIGCIACMPCTRTVYSPTSPEEHCFEPKALPSYLVPSSSKRYAAVYPPSRSRSSVETIIDSITIVLLTKAPAASSGCGLDRGDVYRSVWGQQQIPVFPQELEITSAARSPPEYTWTPTGVERILLAAK